MSSERPVQKWDHSRKGRIIGKVMWEQDVWMAVELVGDHHLRYMAEGNRGRVDQDGEVLILRRSSMNEVE